MFTFFQQIREEFHRITNKNLIDNFREALNQHTWRLLRLYRVRRTAFPSEMDQLLNSLDQEVNFRCNSLITEHYGYNRELWHFCFYDAAVINIFGCNCSNVK